MNKHMEDIDKYYDDVLNISTALLQTIISSDVFEEYSPKTHVTKAIEYAHLLISMVSQDKERKRARINK